MKTPRYLCSHLVTLTDSAGKSAKLTANLEEIWTTGAVIEAEQPAAVGANLTIGCGSASFAGCVVQMERHEWGWRLEVEFSPLTPWSMEKFQPEHLLDASILQPDPSKREQGT